MNRALCSPLLGAADPFLYLGDQFAACSSPLQDWELLEGRSVSIDIRSGCMVHWDDPEGWYGEGYQTPPSMGFLRQEYWSGLLTCILG